MNIGDKIRLQGRTWRGEVVVYNLGANWKIVQNDGGDRLLLEAESGKGDLHWVKTNNDLNFDMEVTT